MNKKMDDNKIKNILIGIVIIVILFYFGIDYNNFTRQCNLVDCNFYQGWGYFSIIIGILLGSYMIFFKDYSHK